MTIGKRVEDLEMYGASLEMPKEAVKAQFKITLKALRKKFGIWGMLGVFLDAYSVQRGLRRDFPETRRRAAEISKIIEKELFALSGIYLALAKRLGRKEAYEFLKFEVIYKLALTSMPLLYQVRELKTCDGDVFENFKKMNIALFERTTEDGTWLMESYKNEPDKLTIEIATCANVELFNELNVPELGRFGCDHDVAGFSAIEKDVNCEFRRFRTIANGDDHCLFEFFRRGTAPDNAHLNI
ncbi:MAG: L-2-amino-thiazoline-4-carboxylic acid hydrolase [Boseongicola sp.]|nr:L-2-amino-thiazoline-4-carboxylic acid hydrolase [Boseongicola sp.]